MCIKSTFENCSDLLYAIVCGKSLQIFYVFAVIGSHILYIIYNPFPNYVVEFSISLLIFCVSLIYRLLEEAS